MSVCYQLVIDLLRPNADYIIINNNYKDIVWNDSLQTKPTDEEIVNKANELNAILGWDLLRCERNKLLKNTDKYMVSDFPHSSESKKNEWITYRQLLRNLPSTQTPELDNFGDLINITWPTKPE